MSILSSLQCLKAAAILLGVHHHIFTYASPLEERQSNPTIKQTVGTYQYVGCYQDGVNGAPPSLQHQLSVTGGMSAEKCTAACHAAGFVLAGLESGQECWCDSYFLAPVLVSDADCNLVCTGDNTELCGAGNRLAIYQDTSVPPLRDFSCLSCAQLRRNGITPPAGTVVTFNLTAQPIVLDSSIFPLATPTSFEPFQVAATALPQVSGQPTLLDLKAFTGTPSFHTFNLLCMNLQPPKLSALKIVDAQTQNNFFAFGPFLGETLQLENLGNNPFLVGNDPNYCAAPNTFSSRSTFIGPPLLARSGLSSNIWGLCPSSAFPAGDNQVVTFAPEGASNSSACTAILLEMSLVPS